LDDSGSQDEAARQAEGFGLLPAISDAAGGSQARGRARNGLLFPKASGNSLEKTHGRADITVHGFKATFKTWAEECSTFPAS